MSLGEWEPRIAKVYIRQCTAINFNKPQLPFHAMHGGSCSCMHGHMVPEPKLPGRKETHQRLACYLNNSEALLSSFSMQTPEKPVPFVKPTTDGC